MSDKLIFAVLGALIGGIVSGVFVGLSCCKTYKKRIIELEEENENLKSQRKRKKARELTEREGAARIAEAEVDTDIHEQLVRLREDAAEAKKLSKENGYSNDEDYDFDDEAGLEFYDPFEEEESDVIKQPPKKKQPSFSMLSQQDYEDDFTYMDSESLTFYTQDNVLADSFDEPINNPERVIGSEALDEARKTDQNYIYVMDEVEESLYEIEINREEAYRDIMRGGLA